jgi:AraC-like DNA-binding protein
MKKTLFDLRIMNFKFIYFLTFILFFPSVNAAEISKTTNKDIQKFYALKKEMGSRSFQLIPFKKKMIHYYNESQKNNKTSLVFRLKENATILENNPTDYVIHALVTYQLLMDRNNRLEMSQVMHRLEQKIKFIKDPILLVFSENTLGGYYQFLNKNKEALTHNFKALNLSEEIHDTTYYQTICYNIASIYLLIGNYKQSELYFNKSIYFEQFGYMTNHCDIALGYSLLLGQQGKINEAIKIYLEIEDQISEDDKAIYYCNLSELLLSISAFERAEQALLKSEKFMHETKNDFALEIVYDNLAKCYSRMNDFKKSYYYIILKDSVINAQKKAENIAQLEELKKADLILIQALQKNNAREKLNHEKTKSQRLIFSLFFAVVLLACLIFFLLRLRSKNKALVRTSLEKMTQKPKFQKEHVTTESNHNVSILLVKNFEKKLNDRELFKDPDITIQKLAKIMGTNVKDLSQTINGHYQLPFRTLINNKRIELAKHLLIDEKYQNYSMLGIAETVGYANKSTFYRQFKEITGVTPFSFQQYAQQLMQNDKQV